jgi:hypothetical protein
MATSANDPLRKSAAPKIFRQMGPQTFEQRQVRCGSDFVAFVNIHGDSVPQTPPIMKATTRNCRIVGPKPVPCRVAHTFGIWCVVNDHGFRWSWNRPLPKNTRSFS